jgi:hypothetical protein
MSPVTAACPNCGGAVEFRYDDSFVRVCSYCNAVVARGDRGFESLGRMGDLTESQSPLALHATGTMDGVGFELVGRAQIAHPRGGGWEEWYARFDNGTWGWLSEAQGRFQISFAAPAPPDLPPFEWLVPGNVVPLTLPGFPRENFTVSEVGAAAYRAAAGEMPYRLEPGQRFRFADLSGDRGGFATIDAGVDPGDPVAIYIGREIGLAELQIAAGSSAPGPEPARKVAAHHVACVQCGGSLELRAPDVTLRVTCPYCAAVLDVDQGHLSYLRSLDERSRSLRPEIPLGTAAEFDGHTLTVIGCVRRSVRVDEVDYDFTEYLLYHPAVGYRWLVDSDHHWSYVTPIAAGEVSQELGGPQHAKRRFRHFQTATARVDHIFGEFYWKVEPGEKAEMTDYVSPPFMLSCEEGQGEIQWSLGRWMQPAEVAARLRAPDGKELLFESPSSVGPHQPFRHRGILKLTAVMIVLLVAAGIAMRARAAGHEIPVRFEEPAPPAEGTTPLGQPESRIFFSEPFELRGSNVAVSFASALSDSWLYIEADLVNEESGLTDSFEAPLEHYSGVEDGESWSEGDESHTAYLAAVPAGRYLLRVEEQWPPGQPPPSLTVTLREGVFRGAHFWFALGALLLVPMFILVSWFSFEKRRWSESDHPWFQGSGDD